MFPDQEVEDEAGLLNVVTVGLLEMTSDGREGVETMTVRFSHRCLVEDICTFVVLNPFGRLIQIMGLLGTGF